MKTPITTLILLCALVFTADQARAHAALLESVPANTAELSESPELLSLRFSENVRLLRLEIRDGDGRAVDSGFSAGTEASSSFSVALPALQNGSYRVEWTIISTDSHRMSGDFSFRVETAAAHQH